MVNKKQLKQKISKKRKTVIRKNNKKNGKKITKKQLKGGENKKYSCVCEKVGTVLNSKKVKCECEVKPDKKKNNNTASSSNNTSSRPRAPVPPRPSRPSTTPSSNNTRSQPRAPMPPRPSSNNTSSQTKPLTILPKTHYNTLELPRDATPEQIKNKYREKAMKHHPDRNKDKSEEEQKKHEEIFKKISVAHETLSDPDKKKTYNSTLP